MKLFIAVIYLLDEEELIQIEKVPCIPWDAENKDDCKKATDNRKTITDPETGEKIDNELSIDHVIPWSYLFSDDIWNLVYMKKSENSSKSNKIPSEKTILNLEKRNKIGSEIIRQNDKSMSMKIFYNF